MPCINKVLCHRDKDHKDRTKINVQSPCITKPLWNYIIGFKVKSTMVQTPCISKVLYHKDRSEIYEVQTPSSSLRAGFYKVKHGNFSPVGCGFLYGARMWSSEWGVGGFKAYIWVREEGRNMKE